MVLILVGFIFIVIILRLFSNSFTKPIYDNGISLLQQDFMFQNTENANTSLLCQFTDKSKFSPRLKYKTCEEEILFTHYIFDWGFIKLIPIFHGKIVIKRQSRIVTLYVFLSFSAIIFTAMILAFFVFFFTSSNLKFDISLLPFLLPLLFIPVNYYLNKQQINELVGALSDLSYYT